MALPWSASGSCTARATSARRSTPTGTRSTRTPTTSSPACRCAARSTGSASPSRSASRCPSRELFAAVWVAQVGRVPVLLLDTDVPDNDDSDRPITHILYVRGREMRLHQELVLGVGGVRALRELGPGARGLAPERGPLRVPAGGAGAGARRRRASRWTTPRHRPAQQRVHDPHARLGRQRALRRRPRPPRGRSPARGRRPPDTGGVPVERAARASASASRTTRRSST